MATINHKLDSPLVVPYGAITVKTGKTTRTYHQGQRILAGEVIVGAHPDTLLDDLGLAPAKKKSEPKDEKGAG
jgi:hypothetical protein